jgi:hypothetical protein
MCIGGAHGQYKDALYHARQLASHNAFQVSAGGKEVSTFGANYVYIVDRVLRLMADHRKGERRRSRNLRGVLADVAREQSIADLWQIYFDKEPTYNDIVRPGYKSKFKSKFIKQWCAATGGRAEEWPAAKLWTEHSQEPKCYESDVRGLEPHSNSMAAN